MVNPRKKKADGKRVSQQPYEQAYQKRKLAVQKDTGGKAAPQGNGKLRTEPRDNRKK